MTAMVDHLREAGLIVMHLNRSLLEGSRDLKNVPGLLKRIIREEMWREWAEPSSGRRHGPFKNFAEFMTKSPDEGGLGTTEKQLRGLCVDDPEALSLLDRALRGRQGRRSDLVSNINEVSRPAGTSQTAALRRLRKDRPDLHDEVLAGRLKAHGAMVKAGFRQKTVSVPVGRPESVAAALRKYMTPDDLAKLIALLVKEAL